MKINKTSVKAGIKKSSPIPKARKPAHNPAEYIAVSGGVCHRGQPESEGGPSAWAEHSKENVFVGQVLGNAITQMAKNPKWRPVMATDRPMTVFVLSDAMLHENERQIVASSYASTIGTYTEARRLADSVRWIRLPGWLGKSAIAELAANEVKMVRDEDPSIAKNDVLFLIWKQNPGSFAGATMIEVGREVCDVVFTLGTETVPAFMDDEDDSDD